MKIRNIFTAFFIMLLFASCVPASKFVPTETLISPTAPILSTPTLMLTPTDTTYGCADVTIIAFAWEDLNGNGIQEDNEPPLPGVKIMLANELVGETYTDGFWQYDRPVAGGCGPEADINTQVAVQCQNIHVTAIAPKGYEATKETLMYDCGPKFGFRKLPQ